MPNISVENRDRKIRKLIFQLVSGGLFGAVASISVMSVLDLRSMGADQIGLSAVALIYMLLGVIVGFGLVAPNLGSKVLNVEDAEEINEQRRVLTGSTIAMFSIGCALLVLSLAGSGHVVSPALGFGALIASLVISAVITVRDWKYYDEMMLQLSRDSGNLAYCITGVTIMVWASAAAVGWIAAPTPFALITVIAGGMLLAVFISAARAGLMMSR
jgi:hypothetical protein